MKISIYNGIKNTTPVRDSDVFKVLDIIKGDSLKVKIAKLRIEDDKSKRNELKSKLPLATFCGVFSSRSKSNIKKPSGLACLDFDSVPDLENLIDKVNKDSFTFASFISPSGNGLKVLVKIPLVDSDEDYKDYYYEVQKHYNQYGVTDDSTNDISRATYLSYDPNLFNNPESDLFTERFNRPLKKISEPSNVPITDQNEIAERLDKWFKKRWSSTNRNNNLHAFARQMNAFGVNISICENYLLRYEQADFREKEILQLINSAYKYTDEHNTQSFEDEKLVRVIKNHVKSGKEIKEIEGIDSEKLAKEVEKHKNELRHDTFWYFTDSEVIKLATHQFKMYLQHNNISKYYPSENGGYIFIKKNNNFIKEFDENRIKDFVLEDLLNRGEIDAWEMCAKNLVLFSPKHLSLVDTSNIEIQRATKEESFVYYKNTAVSITKDEFKLIPYNDLNGLVWEDQVIGRDLELQSESDGEFQAFVWKISGEDKEKYFTLKSVIGYLLHSYQNEGKPQVIIFNDEMISDSPNGGSGKGLLHKGISHIKKISTINGKGFDPNKSFAYQTVNTDTQVLLFDDIDKNFKFENLFSLITEGLTIEKKGKDAVQLPLSDSPKISITTNYTVKGEGGSHKRRVFEVEVSSYFSADHTPEDEFGHLLFSDWDSEEWAKFDNFMLRCVQYYLKNGLVTSKTKNLEFRKLKNDTNAEFIEFMDSKEWDGQTRYYKSELKDLFISEYEEYKYQKWFTTTVFNKWVSKYVDYKGYVMEKNTSNGQKYITIEKVPF
jgi:hypothetical protein